MGTRGCRIAINGLTAFVQLIAIILTIVAITSPQWQIAVLDQVNQLRFIGLYQTCAFGSRQGPASLGQWVCTFIPYGYEPYFHQRQAYMRNELIANDAGLLGFPKLNEIEYNAYGGESWRFGTLILMVLAALSSLVSFAFDCIVICLDVTRSARSLKLMSSCSLIAIVSASMKEYEQYRQAQALCCMIGMLTFAINSQQNENLYILELTAFAIFSLGQAFYVGISALVIFILVIGIQIGAMVLICRRAVPEQQRKPQRSRNYYEGDGYVKPTKQLYVQTDAWDTVPMLEFAAPSQRSIIYPPNKRSVTSNITEEPDYVPYGFQRVYNDVDPGNNYFGEERRPFAATDGWDTSSMREFPPAPPSRIISPPNKRYDDSDLVEMPKFVPYGFEWVNNGVAMEQMILLRERNSSGGQQRRNTRYGRETTGLKRKSLSSVLLNRW